MNLKAKGNWLPIGPDRSRSFPIVPGSVPFRSGVPKPWFPMVSELSRPGDGQTPGSVPDRSRSFPFRSGVPKPWLSYGFRTSPPRGWPKPWIFHKINPQPALGIAKTMVFDWCRRLGRRGNVFLKCPENQVGFVPLQFLLCSCCEFAISVPILYSPSSRIQKQTKPKGRIPQSTDLNFEKIRYDFSCEFAISVPILYDPSSRCQKQAKPKV